MMRPQVGRPNVRQLVAVLVCAAALGSACSRSPLDPTLPSTGDAPAAIAVLQARGAPPRFDRSMRLGLPGAPLPGRAAGLMRAEIATGGERITIPFNGVPGRDGRVDTEDDVKFGEGDFLGSGGSRVIDTEFLPVGVRFELGGMLTTVGGGYNPDGSLNTGTQVILMSVAPGGYPVTPLRIRFDRPQSYITFDLFAQINVIGSAAPVTLHDAEGNVVRSFVLTYQDAIIGGFSPTFLGGRFLVTAPVPFSSIEIGLTVEGGGWFFDNLAFEPEYLVRHVPIDAPASVNPITPNPLRVAVLSETGFDAAQVDRTSLELGDGFARPRRDSIQLTDVDRDGDIDLLATFVSNEAGLTCNATRVVLSGRLLDGHLLWGADALAATCRGAGSGR